LTNDTVCVFYRTVEILYAVGILEVYSNSLSANNLLFLCIICHWHCR